MLMLLVPGIILSSQVANYIIRKKLINDLRPLNTAEDRMSMEDTYNRYRLDTLIRATGLCACAALTGFAASIGLIPITTALVIAGIAVIGDTIGEKLTDALIKKSIHIDLSDRSNTTEQKEGGSSQLLEWKMDYYESTRVNLYTFTLSQQININNCNTKIHAWLNNSLNDLPPDTPSRKIAARLIASSIHSVGEKMANTAKNIYGHLPGYAYDVPHVPGFWYFGWKLPIQPTSAASTAPAASSTAAAPNDASASMDPLPTPTPTPTPRSPSPSLL